MEFTGLNWVEGLIANNSTTLGFNWLKPPPRVPTHIFPSRSSRRAWIVCWDMVAVATPA